MISSRLRRLAPTALLAACAALAIVLMGLVCLQAAFGEPDPAAVGRLQEPEDELGRRVEFGLGTLSVSRDGVAEFGVRPGGLRVASADLVTGSYELVVDEPGEREAGFLSLNLTFSPDQPVDSGAAPLEAGSVRTSIGVVSVIVRDADERQLETRLAPLGDGLRVDVQDSGDVAYPLSVSVARIAPFEKTTVSSFGQREIDLGGGAEVDPFEPAPTVSAFNACNYLSVSAGDRFTLALGDDHVVHAWGQGELGQLGTVALAQRAKPGQIAGLTNINAIAAGGSHGVALDASGVVWTWGNNSDGQLGLGSIVNTATPTPVGGLPPIEAIAAGGMHTLAIGADGSLWAWGENGFGQLGDGTNGQKTAPVQIMPPGSGVAAVAAGFDHSLILLDDGTLRACGNNDAGQLGDGSAAPFSLLPVVVSGPGGYAGIAAGGKSSLAGKHSLAWKLDGSAWSWGANSRGQLGDGTTISRNIPGPVATLSSGVAFMEAGGEHSLAVKNDGTVHAWGANFNAQVGDGTTLSPVPLPSPVAGVSGATRVTGGAEQSLALTSAGRVYSWGNNVDGQLGLGIAAANTFPAHVVDSDLDGFLETVTQVATGANHSLAVKADGSVWAWGDNAEGQIGDNSFVRRHWPVQVMPPGSGAIAVAAGATHSLALLSSGQVRAWGSDSSGQLGNGAAGAQLVPGTVYTSAGVPLSGIAQIAAGLEFSLARESGGLVRSWGSDVDGRLGNGTTFTAPQQFANLFVKAPGGSSNLSSITDIDAGDAHGLALKTDGTVYGWGRNVEGQLGLGHTSSPVPSSTLLSALGPNAAGVVAATSHSAAWFLDGSAKAWGKNTYGQVGDGTVIDRTSPVTVLGVSNVVEMDAGRDFTIARIGSLPPASPNLRAWGANGPGAAQLGDGTFTASTLPVVVRELTDVAQVSAGGSHSLARKSDGNVWGWGQATLGALGADYKDAVPNAKRIDFGPHCSNQAPSCNAGEPILAACDGPTLNGSATDPDGDAVTYAWTTACAGVTFVPNASVPNPQVFFGFDCGVSCVFTLTVSDPSGGTCTDTVSVVVNDATPPAGTMGAIEACYTNLGEAENAARDATGWSDNCGVGGEHVSSEVAGCSVTISVTAEDYCGNLSSAIVYTTTVDSVPPVLSGVPAHATAECSAIPAPAAVTALDDCAGAVSVAFSETSAGGACGDSDSGPATITRTWTAQDACGNLTSASQVITLDDETDPILVGVPADTTIECGQPWPDPPLVTATDNCDTMLELGMVPSEGGDGCAGTALVRTWTVYDSCSNFATQSQTITVVDTTPPMLNGVPADVTVSCTSIPAWPTVTASDICDFEVAVTTDEVRTDGACPDRYTLTRTWTATDDCDNTVVGTQVITVTDTLLPVLAGVPGPVAVECDSIPPAASPTASDDCDPNPGIAFIETIEPGSCPQSYTLMRTWTATDRCGNASSQSQVITVTDTTAPVLLGVPAGTSASCDAVPEAADVTADDNCGTPTVVMAQTTLPGSCPQSYTLRRTWTATDECGNSSSASQDIDVFDQVAPTLNGVPSDATVQCSAVPAAAPVTAADNCDTSVSVSLSETSAPGACANAYTLTRTWTATDDCGNSSSASQVLTVVDTTPPTLAGVPANQTVQCDAVPAPASPTASDNCDGSPSIAYDEVQGAGPCSSSYTLTRTWTATDDCGNSSTAQQVLTVIDTVSPVVTPRSIDLYCLWPANHQYEMFTRSQFSPTITDNCNASPNWRFIGCQSNQPDDAAGGVDGNTSNDCVVDPQGAWFKVRAERDGKKAGGRRYTITIVADDGCGNNSSVTQIGYIYVPLKQPGGTCIAPSGGM